MKTMNAHNTGEHSKATHRRCLFLLIFLFTIGLILSITFALGANESPTKTKFISTTTLFYNMTAPPTVFITSTSETSFCGDPLWISDGQCDDESNKVDCQYDGGDCCLPNSTLTFCIKCICHLTGHRQEQIQTSNERVLVVIGGKIIESPTEGSSTEVIFESKNISHQFFASYPYDRTGTCGGLVGDVIIVCGGNKDNSFWWDDISSECYRFDPYDNEWELIHVMNTPRIHAASIVVDGKLWITGGTEDYYFMGPNYFYSKSSSEFVDPKHPYTFIKGPDMPLAGLSSDIIDKHCLTRLSSHQVMLIGGRMTDKHEEKSYNSNKTFVYDFLVDTWTSGPDMSAGRAGHGCTSFTDKENINWTIVSGGLCEFDVGFKLTEMLEENSSEWTDMAIHYHFTNADLNLINFQGKVMLIEGIQCPTCYPQCPKESGTAIFELVKSANGHFEWILSDISLKHPRTTTFTVLDVPLTSINSTLRYLDRVQ